MNEAVIRAIASEIAALPTRNAYGNDETYVEVITTTISKYLPIEQRKWSCSKCGNVSVGDACLKCESKAGTLFYPDADDLSVSVLQVTRVPVCMCGLDENPRLPRLDILCPKHDGQFPASVPDGGVEALNLCDPALAAADIAYNSTDKEHMRVRIEAELNRWKRALESLTPTTQEEE